MQVYLSLGTILRFLFKNLLNRLNRKLHTAKEQGGKNTILYIAFCIITKAILCVVENVSGY